MALSFKQVTHRRQAGRGGIDGGAGRPSRPAATPRRTPRASPGTGLKLQFQPTDNITTFLRGCPLN